MDGFLNSKIEAQTIYEIYRACRLCGAGAGYKMPIIQNVVDLDGSEVELRQKIRDCVQIEVHQDDKMPPLICELCVDKVNDFYEFLEMCRQTNKRTRLRLGLPPQTMPKGAPDAGDCILGITEPVFINEDSRESLKTRSQGKNSKGSSKNVKSKPQDTKVKITLPTKKETRSKDSIQPRSLRNKQPSPPRLRGTKRSHDDDVSQLSNLQRSKRTAMPLPKSILKKHEVEENSLLIPRSRGSKDKEVTVKKDTSKKVQIVVKTPARVNKSQDNTKYKCKICKIQYSNNRSYHNHMRVHAKSKSSEQKSSGSRRSSSIECNNCKMTFSNKHLLDIHMCSVKAISVNCDTCGREFSTYKSMSKHRSYCAQKKKATAISPALLKKVKPIQIRISRCDSILGSCVNGHYDVSNIPFDYGLDKHCVYPYLSRVRIKSEPSYMVDINDEIKEAFDADKYIHWDSEDTASDMDVEDQDTVKKVDSLTSIALKSIFSPKFLGKVPKKRRKVKPEKVFDSILNASDFDSDIRLGIDSIIDRLEDTIDVSKDKSGDNDSLFGDDKAPIVTNDDFDALFGDTQNNDRKGDVNNVNDSKQNNDEHDGDETIENDENLRIKDDTVSSESQNVSVLNTVNNGEDINKENDGSARNKDDTVSSLSENVSVVSSVNNGEDMNKENDGSAKIKDDSVSSEIKNTVSVEKPVNNGDDIINEKDEIKKSNEESDEIIVNKTENNKSEGNNDKIVESIEDNESTQNNDENAVRNNDTNEKCSLDLDKLNETETRETISEIESIDKNNDKELSNELNVAKEVTNNDQLNDTKVDEKLEENHQNNLDNKNDETLQSSDLKMEENSVKNSTDNEIDEENGKTINATDKNDVEDVTMTESTNKNGAVVTLTDDTHKNEVNDVINTSESTDTTQLITPDTVKARVNGEMDVDEKFSMDDLEDISDSEMDDKKLMDELDEQIGEERMKE